MSHSWTCGETTFVANSDLSGDLTIIVNLNAVERVGHPEHSWDIIRVTIPADDLIAFVATVFSNNLISAIEEADLTTILKDFLRSRVGD